MKTFVTGGTSLLGANLIRELLHRGHQVRALVGQDSNLGVIQDLDIDFYEGDLLDEQSLYSGCKGFDYIIHAAEYTQKSSNKSSSFMEINIRGTQKMVRACESAHVHRMVYVSDCSTFGGGSKECPGTELSEFKGFKYSSEYINSKYIAQQWILSEIEKKRLPILIVNPTNLLGPYDSDPSSCEIILKVIKEQIQICTSGGKNFIDVRDAAIAICNSLTMGIIGESYLLASQNLTYAEFFNLINRIYGKVGHQVLVPGFIFNTIGLMGNFINSISSKKFVLNYTDSRQLSCESYFSGAKASRVLGLVQRPVDEAIQDAIEWFAHNQYIKYKRYA